MEFNNNGNVPRARNVPCAYSPHTRAHTRCKHLCHFQGRIALRGEGLDVGLKRQYLYGGCVVCVVLKSVSGSKDRTDRQSTESLPVCLSQPATQRLPLSPSESARLGLQGGLVALRRLKPPLHLLGKNQHLELIRRRRKFEIKGRD